MTARSTVSGEAHRSTVLESVQSACLPSSGVYKRGSYSSALVFQRFRRFLHNTDSTDPRRAAAPEPKGLS
jgi:hypothetical protein